METSFAMFHETEVPENEVIISRTDLHGVITYVNDTFAQISGYSADELIGRPHNILRHPDMPSSVFKGLWETVSQEQAWEGYVKNMRKDKGYYWVYARVSGVYKEGRLVEYKSLRAHVPKARRIEMQTYYDDLRRAEGEAVRIVSYLPAALYDRLIVQAEEAGKDLDGLLRDRLH